MRGLLELFFTCPFQAVALMKKTEKIFFNHIEKKRIFAACMKSV